MKKLLLIVLLVAELFGQTYREFAAEYKYETSYEKALKRSEVEQKDILVVVISNYCPWCRKLEKRVLAHKVVNSEIQNHYIPLIVNREEGKLEKKFETPIVPVTYIVNYKNTKDIKAIHGYKNREDYLHQLETR